MSEIALTLPDGSVRRFARGGSGADLAAAISASLARRAVAVRVGGALRDLAEPLTEDGAVEIVTRDDPDGLDLIRHDAAHALAEAAKELYPEVQITIGPVIDNGFYYDFSRAEPFTPEDLARLEERMREIVDRDEPIAREVWDRDEAARFFEGEGEHYKAEIVRSIPPGEPITLYRQGGFLDLCRGPHLPSTGRLGKAFKLMSVAGAYWRGDHRNEMLQRIYGTAWRTAKELRAYLERLEEAERRDHRRLGPRWAVPLAGGSRRLGLLDAQGLDAVPHLRGLYAHAPRRERLCRGEDAAAAGPGALGGVGPLGEVPRAYVCGRGGGGPAVRAEADELPRHVQIFRQGIKSYRDLPLRMAEFGACHRNEPSGALHGIMRVRAFTQDDAHIFATEDQVTAETERFCTLLTSVYADFGFEHVQVKFSDRPEVRAGGDEVWDKAETALLDAVRAAGLDVERNPGEGAFYGPKLEFVLRDAIGRDWQCGTFQVDFVLPERLNAAYVDESGEKRRPVMLHRAILGSFERFIGMLIEHYAGRFPLWLAPVQAVVATITGDADEYAREVFARLREAGLRAELDLRNEKIGYKVREHSVAKVPAMLVVGRREAGQGTVALRRLGSRAQEMLAVADSIHTLSEEAAVPSRGR